MLNQLENQKVREIQKEKSQKLPKKVTDRNKHKL